MTKLSRLMLLGACLLIFNCSCVHAVPYRAAARAIKDFFIEPSAPIITEKSLNACLSEHPYNRTFWGSVLPRLLVCTAALPVLDKLRVVMPPKYLFALNIIRVVSIIGALTSLAKCCREPLASRAFRGQSLGLEALKENLSGLPRAALNPVLVHSHSSQGNEHTDIIWDEANQRGVRVTTWRLILLSRLDFQYTDLTARPVGV